MKDTTVRSVVMVSVFTALIIVGAIFSFPAPWNPAVPLTLATLFVILSGMILGPWLGAASTGLYLFLGIVGLPVFAGGTGGAQIIAGPTGGFLFGYVLAAAAAGMIVRINKSLPVLIIAALAGTVSIYLPGFPWMHWRLIGMVEDWSWVSSWTKYTLPFLAGDGVKAIAAVAVTHLLRDRIHTRTENG